MRIASQTSAASAWLALACVAGCQLLVAPTNSTINSANSTANSAATSSDSTPNSIANSIANSTTNFTAADSNGSLMPASSLAGLIECSTWLSPTTANPYGKVNCSTSGLPMINKGHMCMKMKQGNVVTQGCDYVLEFGSVCSKYGSADQCCTIMTRVMQAKIICSGTNGFASAPARSDFDNCMTPCARKETLIVGESKPHWSEEIGTAGAVRTSANIFVILLTTAFLKPSLSEMQRATLSAV